ncbi:MAG TPA: efflux RND transporter periplasmic adaptor subunit [Candidatus Binataceae bacterium]|nr:efflux RND transporter periplasmic adaptor subunit [Candidatus Binataceae bacterium]
MKNGLGKSVVIIAIITVTVVGAYLWYQSRPPEIPAGIVSGNGRVEATEIDIATKFAGRIDQVLVHEGDTVNAGQLVVRMDISELLAQLHEAEAQEQQAIDSRKSDEEIAKLAEIEFEFAVRDYKRYSQLAESNVISVQQLDNYTTKMEAERSAFAAASSKVAADVGAIAAARAGIERVQTQINDSELKAPVRGRVLYRLAEPGEVLPSGGSVVTIIDLTDVYMTIFLPELEAGEVAIGADARVVLDAAPQWPASARVSYVAAQAQFTPKSVETTIERQKLAFRVKVQIDPELLRRFEPWVKVGLPGVAYIQADPNVGWPPQLQARAPIELLKITPHQ